MLTKAAVLSSMGRYGEALAAYDDAQAAYTAAGDPKARAYAVDGKALSAIEAAKRAAASPDASIRAETQARLDDADRFLDDPDVRDYDSGQFHAAELKRIKFELALSSLGCGAERRYGEADASFTQFEGQRPRFAIAFASHATMQLQLASFLHFQKAAADCVGRPLGGFGDVGHLYAMADANFEAALVADPLASGTWLQRGILTYERQVRTEAWDPGSIDRAAIMDQAIARMSRAAELDPSDPYADWKLAITIVARHEAYPQEVDGDLLGRGLAAACRGIGLVGAGRLKADLTEVAQKLGNSGKAACT